MTRGMQEELHEFATALLERRGGLVDWPAPSERGTAVLTPEMAASLHAEDEMIPLSCEPGSDGLCVNLATDFLEQAAGLLKAEPQVGAFRVPELYLKRGNMDDAVRRAFTWLNAKVQVGEVRAMPVEYHTWWFHAAMISEDRWETRFSTTINSSSGVELEIPDPLGLWELQPRPAEPPPASPTYDRAVARARARMRVLAAEFVHRMDSRLERDRKRLRDYYNALLREAKDKRPRGNAKPDPDKFEAKKRAVQLELRRRLLELDQRYATEAVLTPVILIRTEIPTLAVELLVFRKRAQKAHTVFWNPLLKDLEPLCCSRCGAGVFSVAFTNEEVEPLCPACAK